MIRRHGEQVRRGQSYRHRPGVYAILERGGDLLLTCKINDPADIQLPGGGIDPGESPLQALHREVFEETGWRIGAPRRLGAFRRFVWMPDYGIWGEKLCHIYTARPVRPHGPPSEPGHRALWMSLAEAAPRLGNAGDRAFAHAFAEGLLPRSRPRGALAPRAESL
ncbi:8-oxo-dGTP diphosphatase [Limimaricola variabilis]|uniref:8-oxo-dGTP diphosphatase n=1 Tax=Limimaricola variabilis TaxID=1492771 RepID=A0ABR6HLN6_9RHOB|nr:NUDIX hydrolase [Limimaricola variabilis]MBB3711373.1 8-oxo-dGTP diphosphatase [Limimaricola variabilis]